MPTDQACIPSFGIELNPHQSASLLILSTIHGAEIYISSLKGCM
jgi:hypothetical protein